MYMGARPSPFFTGDALYAMELSLSLEKLNFDKLLHLWEVGGTSSLDTLFWAIWGPCLASLAGTGLASHACCYTHDQPFTMPVAHASSTLVTFAR